MDEKALKITLEQVKQFLAAHFRVPADDISTDISFGDLPNWDSLGHMSLMAALETSFGVEVNADAIADLTNIDAIYKYINK